MNTSLKGSGNSDMRKGVYWWHNEYSCNNLS